MTFGEALKNARANAGLSQRELRHLSGVTSETLSRYESDHTTPKFKNLKLILRALNLTFEQLCEMEPVSHCSLCKQKLSSREALEKIVKVSGTSTEHYLIAKQALATSYPKGKKA